MLWCSPVPCSNQYLPLLPSPRLRREALCHRAATDSLEPYVAFFFKSYLLFLVYLFHCDVASLDLGLTLPSSRQDPCRKQEVPAAPGKQMGLGSPQASEPGVSAPGGHCVVCPKE